MEKKLEGSKTFADVLELIQKYMHNQKDIDYVISAFDFASAKHLNQFRKSGEPYINHCVEVTYILAYYQSAPETIAAGLLHDTIEDCKVTYEEIKNLFGDETAQIVDAVTKIHRLPTVSLEETAAATHRKLIIAMAKDVRAVIVKLCDRLHNMRTLKFLSAEKQQNIARETLDVYAPLSHRLGMGELKNELENLALFYLNHDKYIEIEHLIKKKLDQKDNSVDYIISEITSLLNKNDLTFRIFGRTKHIYSVYKKMYIKNVMFEQIFDLQAIRIVTHTKLQCYEILGLIHSEYRPIPGRFKDYIAMPKPNMYQSLHTTIVDTNGNLFEIQIRTEEMDRIAEKGIAAHWVYKENEGKSANKNQDLIDTKLSWLKDFITSSTDSQDSDASEYMKRIKQDVFEANVYVLTPKGKIIDIPHGATPIDFAYRIHSEVGNKTIGAIVNKVIVPLNTELKTGDVVEIRTAKNGIGPSEDWLKFVKSSTARQQIKKALAKREQTETESANELFYKKGLQLIETAINKNNFVKDEIMDGLGQLSVLNYFNVSSKNDLIINVGRKTLSAQLVVTQAVTLKPNLIVQINQLVKKGEKQHDNSKKENITIKGTSGIKLETAACCKPIPGDAIVGYISRGSGIKVHRLNCPNIAREKKRLIDASWSEVLDLTYYPVDLEITSTDRSNLVVDLMSLIATCKIKIESISAKSLYATKSALISCTVYVSDVNHLEYLISKMLQITGIINVSRVTN